LSQSLSPVSASSSFHWLTFFCLLCSIITHDRTLDLQADSEDERDVWVQGLRDLKEKLDQEMKQQLEKLDSEDDIKDITSTPQSPSSPRGVKSSPFSSPSTGTEKDYEDFKHQAVNGVSFVKHGRKGKPHARLVKVNLSSGEISWGSGSLNLHTATDVKVGKTSSVLKSVAFHVADPRLCFSVFWDDRTLDLQAKEEKIRDVWVHGLRTYIRHLKNDSSIHSSPFSSPPSSKVTDKDGSGREPHSRSEVYQAQFDWRFSPQDDLCRPSHRCC
jgi:hypothetical protein